MCAEWKLRCAGPDAQLPRQGPEPAPGWACAAGGGGVRRRWGDLSGILPENPRATRCELRRSSAGRRLRCGSRCCREGVVLRQTRPRPARRPDAHPRGLRGSAAAGPRAEGPRRGRAAASRPAAGRALRLGRGFQQLRRREHVSEEGKRGRDCGTGGPAGLFARDDPSSANGAPRRPAVGGCVAGEGRWCLKFSNACSRVCQRAWRRPRLRKTQARRDVKRPSSSRPSRAERSGAEPSRAEPSRAEPSRAEPRRSLPSKSPGMKRVQARGRHRHASPPPAGSEPAPLAAPRCQDSVARISLPPAPAGNTP